jgi:hypothetical protein
VILDLRKLQFDDSSVGRFSDLAARRHAALGEIVKSTKPQNRKISRPL